MEKGIITPIMKTNQTPHTSTFMAAGSRNCIEMSPEVVPEDRMGGAIPPVLL